jgi:hypothetical protein
MLANLLQQKSLYESTQCKSIIEQKREGNMARGISSETESGDFQTFKARSSVGPGARSIGIYPKKI